MRIRLAFALVTATLLGGCGAATHRTPPPAATPAPLLSDLLQDPEASLALKAIPSSSATWCARLEAERLVRRDHPAGGAAVLAARARQTRSAFELTVTLEGIAAGYPAEAGPILTRMAQDLGTEPEDARRLAGTVLRFHVATAYAAAVPLLVRAGEDSVFAARSAVLRAGPALAPLLRQAQTGQASLDLVLRLLADGAAGTPLAATDVQELVREQYPPRALTLAAEVAGAAATPWLERALADAPLESQIAAAAALAQRQVDSAAPAIQALLQAHPSDPRRGPLLAALGILHDEAAEDLLTREAHDATMIEDADGVAAWPIAEAALAGLGHLHGDIGHDGLRALAARSDRPAVGVAAARALAQRGDTHDVQVLQAAAEAMYRQGHALEASQIADARDQLLGRQERRRDCIAYLLRYTTADGTTTALLADTPLITLAEGGRGIVGHSAEATVVQLTVPLARAEIMRAIQLRNGRRLSQLRIAGTELQYVDLLAR